MSDAPERISLELRQGLSDDFWSECRDPRYAKSEPVAYVRADRIEAQEALLAKATKLLAEADGDLSVYVGVEYPKELRAKYPSIERQWQRDMQLCREIDAFLKEIDNG